MQRITLSNRQYALLRRFAAQGVGARMSELEVGAFHQTTFGSMIRREWIFWDGRGFRLSAVGRQAIKDFEHADIMRRVASLKLTSFFHR